jgi:biotin carboxyl carrier protein
VGLVKISARAGSQILDVTVEKQNGSYIVEVDGVRHEVDSHKLEGDFYSILTGGKSYEVSVEPTRDGYRVRHGAAEQLVTLSDPGREGRAALDAAHGPERVVSLMPGKVVRVLVNEGDEVEAGQGVVVVEAMKMENEIAAGKAGRVASVLVRPQQTVEGGADLLVIE